MSAEGDPPVRIRHRKILQRDSDDENNEEDEASFSSESEPEETTSEILESDRNIFKTPWKGSDIVLVVEEYDFNVHKTMLSLHSPVFDSMFNKQFKESEADSVPLPGKKAVEFLDFLLQIYPQTKDEITMKNVGHLLALADEYQTEQVSNTCKAFLKSYVKSSLSDDESIMGSLVLAQKYGLNEVQNHCCTSLRKMKFSDLMDLYGFDELDLASTKNLLFPKLLQVENSLDFLFPQVLRLLDFATTTYLAANGNKNELCLAHPRKYYQIANPGAEITKQIKKCIACKEMVNRLDSYILKKSHVRGVEGLTLLSTLQSAIQVLGL